MLENSDKYSEEEARAETDAAKTVVAEFGEVAARTDHVLLTLHRRHAHTALGFKSWRKFVEVEFPTFEVSRSYQLLRHSRKVEEIETTTGQKSGLNESQTRKLPASAVPDVAAKAHEKMRDGMDSHRAHAAALAEVLAELEPSSRANNVPETPDAAPPVVTTETLKMAAPVATPETPEKEPPAATVVTSAVEGAQGNADQPHQGNADRPEQDKADQPEQDDAAAALQEASTDLERLMSETRALREDSADEKWIQTATEFLRDCPDLATLDAFELDLPEIFQEVRESLTTVRLTA